MAKEISTAVQELSAKLATDLTIVDGKATLAKTSYIGNLPEGITAEQVRAISTYNATFYPAITKAFGEKANEAMVADKTIDKLFLEAPMDGRDHFDLTYYRSRQYAVPKKEGETEAGDPITKFGVIVPSLTTYATSGKRGEMNLVCNMLSEMALEAFGK